MASTLPETLNAFLHTLALDGRAVAFLRVDGHGRVASAGGELTRYGVERADRGASAEDCASFLCGLIPIAGRSASFRWLEVAPGVTADLHLVQEGDETWVLLLDATDDAAKFQAFQQKGNEITLERDRLRARVAELEAELRALRPAR